MAALIAVGIGLGAEKLSRKISEKRLERKEKKSAAEPRRYMGRRSPSLQPHVLLRHRVVGMKRSVRRHVESLRMRHDGIDGEV
ncbi:hypothetical protein ACN47E_004464 [Coniothyrium glycines]